MTTPMIGRQARCCHLTLRTFWSRLIPLRSMTTSQTRTRSLIFRRCALVQNAQSRMRTKIIRSTKTLKRRRSANVFILPQLCTSTTLRCDEGDEIDWDQLSDEEFESKMEKLKVKERERITHRDIALERYKDLTFRACDKSNLTVDR
jgi:hypothetical protein